MEDYFSRLAAEESYLIIGTDPVLKKEWTMKKAPWHQFIFRRQGALQCLRKHKKVTRTARALFVRSRTER